MTEKIERLRRQFNEIDKTILLLLGARCQLSRKMAKIKRENQLDIIQNETWDKNLKNRIKENCEMKVNERFLKNIFNAIHKESIRIQKKELNNVANN